MGAPAMLGPLLITVGLAVAASATNPSTTVTLRATLTHKFQQMFTIPLRSSSYGSSSGFSTGHVMNAKGDSEALRHLKNILQNVLASLPEPKKSSMEPVNALVVTNQIPPYSSASKTPSPTNEVDYDVSDLLDTSKNGGYAHTAGPSTAIDMSQSKSNAKAENPPSYLYTTSGKFQNVVNESEKALDKSIKLEESAENALVNDISSIIDTQQHLKGKSTSDDTAILANLENLPKEPEPPATSALPDLPPYQESVKETEKLLDKRIQMEEKAAQMMDKEIASMKTAQKHFGSSDDTNSVPSVRALRKTSYSSARSLPPPGILPGSSTSGFARAHKMHPGKPDGNGDLDDASEDMQQLIQLMQYLDKYVPNLNAVLRMDTEATATESAISLLALMKNFLCLGKEKESNSQNSQKYFKPLIEDEMHILKMLLESSD